ncbi:alpha/beta hydrolase fold domain-containing protein [Duganella sp. FT80W]|uniref:Alpha/beta hydrolase fold domain-containing protein n=1 Tax=Duganella guangzhouensis TaxID=2666084 RepID=A0A6I2L8M6_9BURK|nr:alpha/beta hydrolase [Duganella guangzhouensis]MRW93567.1 alpha/beta hydrolase fold domain-containing protein [Duganella guangzhouensis]
MRNKIAVLLLALCAQAGAQQLLWPDGAPGAEKRHGEAEKVENSYVSNIHDPSLTVARANPRHANGAAVIIVPGGGHRMLVWQNEGMVAAKSLNRVGVTAFVLKYRLARDGGSGYSIENDAAADLRRALRWVRAHAVEYGVDPQRVGVMGFSAGGELVSLVADNPEPAPPARQDAVDKQSARPDFQILVYPGPLGVPAKAVAGAPPAFIVAGSNDKCCMPPALALYQQLVGASVSAELHLYADTDHAFNMGQRSERLSDVHWPDRVADWLSDGGWLIPRKGESPQGVPAP